MLAAEIAFGTLWRGAEGFENDRGIVGESREVLVGHDHFVVPTPDLELHREQFAEHERPEGWINRRQDLLDPRSATMVPFRLELVADLVDPVCRRQQ